MKQLLAVSILVFIFVGNAYAPDEQKFKVYVEVLKKVLDEEKNEHDFIESHLKRELRALGNVVIVDEKDDWQFRIFVNLMRTEYKDGSKTQTVVIATSVQRRVPRLYFKNYEFKSPAIPVFDYSPAVASYPVDKLHNWCISTASDLDEFFR